MSKHRGMKMCSTFLSACCTMARQLSALVQLGWFRHVNMYNSDPQLAVGACGGPMQMCFVETAPVFSMKGVV